MDILIVAVELVLAGETLLVVFALNGWAFEAFGIDAVLGRGVAHQVAPAFSGVLAVGFTASPISRLTVMGLLSLMAQEKIQRSMVPPLPMNKRVL